MYIDCYRSQSVENDNDHRWTDFSTHCGWQRSAMDNAAQPLVVGNIYRSTSPPVCCLLPRSISIVYPPRLLSLAIISIDTFSPRILTLAIYIDRFHSRLLSLVTPIDIFSSSCLLPQAMYIYIGGVFFLVYCRWQ